MFKRRKLVTLTALLLIVILIAALVSAAGGVFFGCNIIEDKKKACDKAVGAGYMSDLEESNNQPCSETSNIKPSVVTYLGEEEGTLYISWSGRKSDCWIRLAESRRKISEVNALRGERSSLPEGDAYSQIEKKSTSLPEGEKNDAFRYCIEARGLTPGKKYYYEIGDSVTYDTSGYIKVPKASGNDAFAYLGDPQPDKDVEEYRQWQKLVKRMLKNNPDIEFGIIGGDMVNVPSSGKQWKCFLQSCSSFGSTPVVLAPGNHEGVSSNKTYKNLFCHINNGPEGEAFYYFDYGLCRFVVLDSSFLTKERKAAMGEALWSVKKQEIDRWLESVLGDQDNNSGREKNDQENKKNSDRKKNEQVRWKIVVMHHPAYGMHDLFTVSEEIRNEWLPTMRKNDVDLVFCGHQHLYMRTQKIDGIVHVMGVSGGKRSNYYCGLNKPVYCEAIYSANANYQVIKVTKHRLKILSYNNKGTIIDGATITKYP